MKLNEEKLTDEALKQYLFDNLAEETKSLSSKQIATTFNSVSVDEIVRIIQNQERMYFLTKEEKELIIEGLKILLLHYKKQNEYNKKCICDELEIFTIEIKTIQKLLDKLGVE